MIFIANYFCFSCNSTNVMHSTLFWPIKLLLKTQFYANCITYFRIKGLH